jgi:hypothetical protein
MVKVPVRGSSYDCGHELLPWQHYVRVIIRTVFQQSPALNNPAIDGISFNIAVESPWNRHLNFHRLAEPRP